MQRRTPHLPFAYAFSICTLALAALTAVLLTGTASASPSASGTQQSQQAPLTSTLVINEVYDSSNAANEYMELYNASATITEDLYRYLIHNSDVNPQGTTYLSTLTTTLRYLPPHSYVAIGPSQFFPTRSTLVGDGLATSDYLALATTAADSPPVDIVNWGGNPNPNWYLFNTYASFFFAPGTAPQMPAPDGPNSLSRYPNGYDTDSPSDWRTLPASGGFPNPNPTPGAGTATPTTGCEDSYEPDNTQAQAKVLEQNTEQVHTLCTQNGAVRDRDWFVFTAIAGKLYTMLTKDLTGPVDTIMTLYDANGNTLAFNDDYQPGVSLASRIDYTFSSNGTYYIQVRDGRSNGGLGYQYTMALISTGALPATTTSTGTPTVNPNATPTSGPCYDAYEPDGVPETAKLFLIGTVQHHSICPTADADWERFYARAGKVYTIRTGTLGAGLDTYMYLFDSDAKTILAQNDDGGDGVASRIDFYPQRDDWYYIQVKNAGDIGGPDQTYDLSLAVQPGVPQPPGTATNIIAPPVTGTPVPTQGVQPTKPPVPTPTSAGEPPTPTPRPTTGPLPNQPTAQPTAVLPGVPNTGYLDNFSKPVQTLNNVEYTPILFRVFYDANHNSSYDLGEGIRGLQIFFVNSQAGNLLTGKLVTGDQGSGKSSIPVSGERIYIPYLGINMPLTRWPDRELHSLWLGPLKLPDKVP